MNTAEAIAHAEAGGRATCDDLPPGAVLKVETLTRQPEDGCEFCGGDCSAANPPVVYCPMQLGITQKLRVVFEQTGDGYDFTPDERYDASAWRKVEGWAVYG